MTTTKRAANLVAYAALKKINILANEINRDLYKAKIPTLNANWAHTDLIDEITRLQKITINTNHEIKKIVDKMRDATKTNTEDEFVNLETHPTTVIYTPDHITRPGYLTPNTRKLITTIVALAENTPYVDTTAKRLAEKTGLSAYQVTNGIRELEERRLITVTQENTFHQGDPVYLNIGLDLDTFINPHSKEN